MGGPPGRFIRGKTVQNDDTKKPAAAEAGRFNVTDSGVYHREPNHDRAPDWICSRLDVIAFARNPQGEDWGLLVSFKDPDGQVHELALPMEALAGYGTECRARLMNLGLKIAPNARAHQLLSQYLLECNPQKRVRCVQRIGWHDGIFVFPESTIGPQTDEPLVFQGAGDLEHQFRVAGTIDDWRREVGARCAGNSRLVFGISSAFAPPLLNIVGEESGGLHYRGPSSIGKTTTLMVAGSVWGGGGSNGFLQTWRATSNGLEAVAALHSDSLLCLDELSQLDPNDAGQVAYQLANGLGKSRMTASITARRRLRWRLLFLSSGEISLADHIRTRGHRSRGGQEVRLLDIPADAGKGLGLFEHAHPNPDTYARHLSSAAKRYYGTPIREFLTKLANGRDSLKASVDEYRSHLLRTYSCEGASGEVSRAAGRFALVAVAGELATGMGITGWGTHHATWGVGECFKAWLDNRGTVGAADEEAAVRQVKAFIEKHGASRFQDCSSDRSDRVIDRAGFRHTAPSGEIEYLILPQAFRNDICRGFDYQMVARALSDRGYLLVTEAGHWTNKRELPVLGKKRVYVVRGSILEA